MSKAIDALRSHINQVPIPKAKCRLDERDRLNAMIDAIEAENAKLQKVCKRMHDHIKDSCDVCDEYYCSSWDEDNECCVFDSYMRELGIEEELVAEYATRLQLAGDDAE